MSAKPEVYIVGGGPSLLGFDFDKLKDKTTIVVNDSVKFVPNPTYFLTMDEGWVRSHHQWLDLYAKDATRVFIVNTCHPDVTFKDRKYVHKKIPAAGKWELAIFDNVIESSQEGGLSLSWYSPFRNGRNSGYSALQWAVLMNYKTIHLLGIDLCASPQSHHHHQATSNVGGTHLCTHIKDYAAYWRVGLMTLQYTDTKVVSYSPDCPMNDIIPYKRLDSII